MTCPVCFRKFTPRIKTQVYCCKECYDKTHDTKRRNKAKELVLEWLAWNQDFKLGKTTSNL